MARSPFTLAAAATAAFSGADIVGARRLTAEESGRYDGAVATLSDGREIVVRIPTSDEALADAESELVALRALTHGVRDLLPFDAPEFLGSAPAFGTSAIVTDYLPGYQVEAAHIPAGRGVAGELGAAIARIHALPASIVRSAGLPQRSAADSRADLEKLLDTIGRSGRVPVRLMVRWREAAEDERLWSYESTIVLGGVQAEAFLFQDGTDGAPRVTSLLDWHGLSIGDPAIDLHWTESAPDAADDVFRAYASHAVRAPDDALRVRARLHAELEFARWLVHGMETHQPDVVSDAADLLDSLSAGLADDRLLADLPDREPADVSEAIALLDRVPRTVVRDEGVPPRSDTSIHTDVFSPEELGPRPDEEWDPAPPREEAEFEATQPVSTTDEGDDTQPLERPAD